MDKIFYLDTSVLLDLFEKRGEFGEVTKKFIKDIINANDKVAISEIHFFELKQLGYLPTEINQFLFPFKSILLRVSPRKDNYDKAQRMSIQRKIPKRDILHVLVAKENDCIFISRDHHFEQLKDLIRSHLPEEFI